VDVLRRRPKRRRLRKVAVLRQPDASCPAPLLSGTTPASRRQGHGAHT
jgi:hypothetical protein